MMKDDVSIEKLEKSSERGKTRTMKVGGYNVKDAIEKAKQAVTAGPIADNLRQLMRHSKLKMLQRILKRLKPLQTLVTYERKRAQGEVDADATTMGGDGSI